MLFTLYTFQNLNPERVIYATPSEFMANSGFPLYNHIIPSGLLSIADHDNLKCTFGY